MTELSQLITAAGRKASEREERQADGLGLRGPRELEMRVTFSLARRGHYQEEERGGQSCSFYPTTKQGTEGKS